MLGYQPEKLVDYRRFLYYPATKEYIWNPVITDETENLMAEVRLKVSALIKRFGCVRELGKEYCISLNPKEMSVEQLYQRILEQLDKFRNLIEITHSKCAVDITSKGVNKGSGTKFLSKVTGIALKDILGIGDTLGDISWLSLVGHPTCPANADEDVRQIAEYVSPFETTGGVIDIIQRYTGIYKKQRR